MTHYCASRKCRTVEIIGVEPHRKNSLMQRPLVSLLFAGVSSVLKTRAALELENMLKSMLLPPVPAASEGRDKTPRHCDQGSASLSRRTFCGGGHARLLHRSWGTAVSIPLRFEVRAAGDEIQQLQHSPVRFPELILGF